MKKPKVVNHDFPENQYYKEFTENTQICLHHLASGKGIKGDLEWWKSNKERVATCVAVSRDGTINTFFDSKYWAHHLGIKIKMFDKHGIKRNYQIKDNGKKYVSNNEELNKSCIGLELDSWGELKEKNGKFYSWTNTEIDFNNVVEYESKYRGHRYYEKYTPEQINSTRFLLKHWEKEYNIDIKYKGDRIFDVCKDALEGAPGVFSHTSFREDKKDIHPFPPLIKMLKSL